MKISDPKKQTKMPARDAQKEKEVLQVKPRNQQDQLSIIETESKIAFF